MCWFYRRKHSCKRGGRRSWTPPNTRWAHKYPVWRTRRCSNTWDRRKPHTRSCTPRILRHSRLRRWCSRRSRPSAPRGTTRWGRTRSPCSSSSRRRRPAGPPALADCSRPRGWRRRNRGRRRRSAWTRPMWQAEPHRLLSIPRCRSRSPRLRRWICRWWSPENRVSCPKCGRTRRRGRRLGLSRRSWAQIRWWRAAECRRPIVAPARLCRCIDSLMWMWPKMRSELHLVVKHNKFRRC